MHAGRSGDCVFAAAAVCAVFLRPNQRMTVKAGDGIKAAQAHFLRDFAITRSKIRRTNLLNLQKKRSGKRTVSDKPKTKSVIATAERQRPIQRSAS